MTKAGHTAIHNYYQSGESENAQKSRWSQFVEFMKDSYPEIKDMKDITEEHVKSFAQDLAKEIEDEGKSVADAHNKISCINVVMSVARGDNEISVSPREAIGHSRSGIRETENPNSQEAVEKAMDRWFNLGEDAHGNDLGARFAAMSDLAREFGARNEEAAKFPAKEALSQVEKQFESFKQGKTDSVNIRIEYGNKGGAVREFEVVPLAEKMNREEAIAEIERKIDVLRDVAEAQGNSGNCIPREYSFREFDQAYRNSVAGTGYSMHADRREWANDRWELVAKTMGYDLPSPVRSDVPQGQNYFDFYAEQNGISRGAIIGAYKEIQQEVSEALGHHRPDVCNQYCGSGFSI